MRQLATIQEIAEIKPIDGADAIEAVRVKDWWCVAKKGEFQVGDTCVYIEIDSLLPSNNPIFDFLKKGTKEKTMVIDDKTYTGYRLRTIKLRGQISQGLALRTSLFGTPTDMATIGTDVSETIGIVKYEAPIPAQLQGKVKGVRPPFIPKTDEERVQNLGDIVEKYQGTHFYITEKLDGSSATFFKTNTEFGVCSRNMQLLETEGNSFWEMAKRYDLANKLPEGYCIQGELVGTGIQGNPLGLNDRDVYFFNVYNMENGNYLDFDDFRTFIASLGVKHVPIVNPDYILDTNVEGLLDMSEIKSVLNPSIDAEGIVFRPHIEIKDVINKQISRLSFKAISNKYLLEGHD